MIRYVLKRIGLMLLSFVIIMTVCFFLVKMLPLVVNASLGQDAEIAEVVGDCGEYTPDFQSGEKVKSPGVLYKHYSPRCQTILVESENV